ncbi:transposase [Caballeronia arationis]|nr:transposase [Caballeronia arationis]
MLSLHRMRSQLIKFRTMQVNQLRRFLYRFEVTFRTGRVAGLAEVRERMAQLVDTSKPVCRESCATPTHLR